MVSRGFLPNDRDSMGISNNFYVKLKQGSDYEILVELAEKSNIKIRGRDRFMPLWYILSCDQNSTLNSIDAANYFYESGLFENTEPEFILHNLFSGQVKPSDPYFSDQWYLWNVGQSGGLFAMDMNMIPAWVLSKGTDVRIAIFDTGFEMDHPDLIANVSGVGYDVETGTSPSVVYTLHGTAVAGIAGAAQNYIAS